MSRASIIGMLVAVEVLIAGIALYAIGAGGWHGMHVFASGMHRVSFVAVPIAPIEAGATPRVAVDDPNSRVEVGVSTDGMVHVKDLTNISGNVWSSSQHYAQLKVTKTADGVSVVRPYTGGIHGFNLVFGGWTTEKIEIDVPSGSHLDIARCSGADVTGLNGGVVVRSQDGHIKLEKLTGTVDAASDDGYVEATGIHGDSLTIHSADGHVGLRDIAVPVLSATTSDGRITASELNISGAQPKATLHSNDGSVRVSGAFAPGGAYDVSTNDGRIYVDFMQGADLNVDASTSDGNVTVDGQKHTNGESDSNAHTFKLGNGSGNFRIASNDGSIFITTNGAQ